MIDVTKAKVFTTGQVAELCRVAPRTVSKWFDSGRLKGYRIPGSQDRRIPRSNLIAFMKEHGVPLGELKDGSDVILLVGVNREAEQSLTHLLAPHDLDLKTAHSSFDAGLLASSLHPHCMIIDSAIGVHDADAIARTLRMVDDTRDAVIIGLVSDRERGTGLDESLFTETFRKPFDMVLLAERVRGLLSAVAN